MFRFKEYIAEDCKLRGLAKGKTPEDIAKKHKVDVAQIQKQIRAGIEVELEHTKSRTTARAIAMDHVFEDPKYYDKLKKVETQEDAPVNSVGGGNIAGIGPGEIPPVRKFTKRRDLNKKYQVAMINKGILGGQPTPY